MAVDNVVLDAGDTPSPNLYSISVAEMKHGTVTADKKTAAAGSTVTLTVKLDEGYQLKSGSLLANDIVVSDNTFTMPNDNVIVTALFEKKDDSADKGAYKDGIYTGTAKGHNKNVNVSVKVTVEDGKIAKIEVTEQEETDSYWANAVAIIEKLLGLGNDEAVAKVDTIGGATESSQGIKDAVKNALKNAVKEESGIFDGGNNTIRH